VRQESGQAVLWIQGKGRDDKDDFVLLVEETLQPLQDYLAARGPVSEEEPLFASHSDRNRGQGLTTRSISRIVKQATSGGGPGQREAHGSLRAPYRDHAGRSQWSQPSQVQAMARHSDP